MAAVAVVGGGLCGVAAAEVLLASGAEVALLDMGRGGVGGRASARKAWLAENGAEATSPESACHVVEFEHGCQFLSVVPEVKNEFSEALEQIGAERWPAGGLKRLGWLSQGAFLPKGCAEAEGFGPGLFGACGGELELRIALGACSKLVAAAAEKHPGRLSVHRGARVTGIARMENGLWELRADGLHHEKTAEELRSSTGNAVLQQFDAVIFTDHMAFLPEWHPLHVSGLQDAAPKLVAKVRSALDWDEETRRFRGIASLFTCMVAFAPGAGPGGALPFDGACVAGSTVLQWICRQASKFCRDADGSAECWVLVSTEAFADSCLRGEPMSERRGSGDVWYRPQTDEYLKGDPAVEMVRAFAAAVGPLLPGGKPSSPLYARCQRWGAAYPKEREAAETSAYYAAHEHDGAAASGLFAAGDWAQPMPPRHAEAAFASGRAAAAAAAKTAKAVEASRPKRPRTS